MINGIPTEEQFQEWVKQRDELQYSMFRLQDLIDKERTRRREEWWKKINSLHQNVHNSITTPQGNERE